MLKLLRALQDRSADSEQEYGGVAGAATGVGEWFAKVDEHIATGARECSYCPLCQVIAAVRATSPEVKRHLRVAGSALLQAAAGALADESQGDRTHQDGAFEHIDVSDEDDWEDH
jgi:hypothetical protein